jgi:hypothetical protein
VCCEGRCEQFHVHLVLVFRLRRRLHRALTDSTWPQLLPTRKLEAFRKETAALSLCCEMDVVRCTPRGSLQRNKTTTEHTLSQCSSSELLRTQQLSLCIEAYRLWSVLRVRNRCRQTKLEPSESVWCVGLVAGCCRQTLCRLQYRRRQCSLC